MESEKLGPRDWGPHLAVASVSSRVPAARSEAGGPAEPAPPPRSPPPTARPRPEGSRARRSLCKRPPSGGLGPLPNRLAYQGSVLSFLPEQEVGTRETSGKGTKIEGQVRDRGREWKQGKGALRRTSAPGPGKGEKVWA